MLQCLCREICWHGWHLFGCVTFLTRFQLEGWKGEERRRWGWWDRVLSLRREFFWGFFFHVCENAKRAAPYNGGVMGEAVRGVSVKDTLGSASRRDWSLGLFCLPHRCSVGPPCGTAPTPHVQNECHETRHELTSSSHQFFISFHSF